MSCHPCGDWHPGWVCRFTDAELRPTDAEQRCGPAEKLSAGLAVLKIAITEGREKKGDVQRVKTDLQ